MIVPITLLLMAFILYLPAFKSWKWVLLILEQVVSTFAYWRLSQPAHNRKHIS